MSWDAFRPASKLLVCVVYFAILVPALLALGYFDPGPSSSLVLAVFINSAIVALALTWLIDRWLRRWFFV